MDPTGINKEYPVKDRHFINTHQLTRPWVEEFLERGRRYAELLADPELADGLSSTEENNLFFTGRVRPMLGLLFVEPSTRTRLSFEAAIKRMGGLSQSIDGLKNTSTAKGELWPDTAQVISGYPDAMVIRHPEEAAILQALGVSRVPVISGGGGSNSHPTQTLVDLLAMKQQIKNLDSLKVAICGDLKYGRTVRSLVTAFALLYPNVKLTFVSDSRVAIGEDIKRLLEVHKVDYHEASQLGKAILVDTDVLYMTRIQKERFSVGEDMLFADVLMHSPRLDSRHADYMPDGSIILHPLPRGPEINPDVDKRIGNNGRPGYFLQSLWAVSARMALLDSILKPASFKNKWLPFKCDM